MQQQKPFKSFVKPITKFQILIQLILTLMKYNSTTIIKVFFLYVNYVENI